MDMFAIQHTPTGRLLPIPRGRGGRGGTHTEFEDDGVPRLFPSEASAKSALRWWLGGTVTVGQTVSGYFGEEVDEDWRIIPQPHRKASEVRVVRIKLEVV